MRKTDDIDVRIVAGPDPEGGCSWALLLVGEEGDDPIATGSARGPKRTGNLHDYGPWDWTRWLKRELAGYGIRWADATVKPDGWSEGGGHAPQGVVVRGTMRRPVRR